MPLPITLEDSDGRIVLDDYIPGDTLPDVIVWGVTTYKDRLSKGVYRECYAVNYYPYLSSDRSQQPK